MTENEVFSPTIGVGVLVWRNSQLLLGKRIDNDQGTCWQFPGGHLENNESVTECASREVLEETGLTVTGLRHLGFTNTLFVMAERRYITLLISCDYTSGEVQSLEPGKCEAWRWFDYRRLPEPLFEPIEIFLVQHGDLLALHNASLTTPVASPYHRKRTKK